MAILRRELQGRAAVTNLFDAICEEITDMQSDEAGRWVPGSLMYCAEDKSVYLKGADGTWEKQ